MTKNIILDKEEKGFFSKLKETLSKTRENISQKMDEILKGYAKIDEDLFLDLEELLISSDIGVKTAMDCIDELRNIIRINGITNPDEIKIKLKDILYKKLYDVNKLNPIGSELPTIVLVVGVNGVGKTTTIGKLGYNLKNQGKNVLLVAGDTFRAGAVEQLSEWALKSNLDIVSQKEGADPASVVFDAIQSAKSKNKDVIIIDTAGRLHNKKNLMNELNKIYRIISKEYAEAYIETLLVLDATTGQNALIQAKQFKEVVNITGIILTKLDGTAKGGIVFSLEDEYKVPIKMIGVGENISDLKEFDSKDFVDAIFS